MNKARRKQFEIPTRMPMTNEQRQGLWLDFLASREPFMRNTLVVEYLPVVKCIAETINSRLPDSVMLEDLVSYGTFGLLDAIESFDISRGAA
jgi:RNA polymerase sigma factor for flagellar operon FliA